MKINILGIAFLFLFTVSGSCQIDMSEQTQKNLFEKIAQDESYAEMQKITHQKLGMIIRKEYDPKEMMNLLNRYNIDNICDADPNLFSKIKNGKIIYELSCQYSAAFSKLNEKYKYSAIPIDGKGEIRKIYVELTGGRDKEELMKNAFNQLQKE